MNESRFERQLPLFGEAGQEKLRAARVTVIGAGGTGSLVIPELAMLGVGSLTIVEHDEVEHSNRNRHFCARHTDPIPGTQKADTARRMVLEYDPTIEVAVVTSNLLTRRGFDAVKSADYVFGCVDLEGVRLVLTELCAAYARPYIDVSSGIEPGSPPLYGGRVCCAIDGNGCLVCLGEIDLSEAARDLESPDERRNREAIYGVDQALLKRGGPSVVSINGVVASLAVTEFMKLCTGLDRPTRLLKYDGRASRVSVSRDEPSADCYYCKGVWGAGSADDVERFLRPSVS
ncbi:MAG: ThiF family adenylyltransferase [Phycisphaerales bacterium]|nr:ThiF family adenylyltransferase [Phycisphaerales bacterium]